MTFLLSYLQAGDSFRVGLWRDRLLSTHINKYIMLILRIIRKEWHKFHMYAISFDIQTIALNHKSISCSFACSYHVYLRFSLIPINK